MMTSMTTMASMATMATTDGSGGNKLPLIVDCVILYTAPIGAIGAIGAIGDSDAIGDYGAIGDSGATGATGARADGGGGRQRQQQRQRRLLEKPIKEYVRTFVAAFDADDPRIVRYNINIFKLNGLFGRLFSQPYLPSPYSSTNTHTHVS